MAVVGALWKTLKLERILEEIEKRFMLQFSSNSNEINNGKECYIRNSCWIRKGCVG